MPSKILIVTLLIFIKTTILVAQPAFNSVWTGASQKLPSEACPPWALVTENGAPQPALSADTLVIETTTFAESAYYKQSDGQLSIPNLWVIEFRMKLVSGAANLPNFAPAGFAVVPRASEGNILWIGADDLFLWGPGLVRGPSAAVDTDGGYHLYRIEVDSLGGIKVYQDASLIISGSTVNDPGWGTPRLNFGDLWLNEYSSTRWLSLEHNGYITPFVDSDGDSIADYCDNCPLVSNSTQLDADGDKWGEVCDCNDANAAISPGAIEKCDGIDNNCDLAIDDPYFCGGNTACQGMVLEVFARHVPAVAGLEVSRGGAYGDYMYFSGSESSYASAGGDSIFRIDPSGNWSYFGKIPAGSANISDLVFDNTPDQRYGGYLYAVGDNSGALPTNQGGIYRIYPDGTSSTFMEGSIVPPAPGLLGQASSVIDDIGTFGNQMIVSDFEAEDYGFTSNIFAVSPVGGVTSWNNTILMGAYAMEQDHFGSFSNDILVSSIQFSPWWQGDNAVYELHPNGTKSLLIPDQGQGLPVALRVDAIGGFGGNLLAYYDSGKLIAFDGTGTEKWRADGPGINLNSVAQDYWGAFGYDIFIISSGDSTIYRMRPANAVNSDSDSIPDFCDNCDLVANPAQSDCDNDGIGDACDFLSGDADNSGAITISDAVLLINYIFSGGPAPCPIRNGDADCSSAVTISDAVYLINYIFAGGPAPC